MCIVRNGCAVRESQELSVALVRLLNQTVKATLKESRVINTETDKKRERARIVIAVTPQYYSVTI